MFPNVINTNTSSNSAKDQPALPSQNDRQIKSATSSASGIISSSDGDNLNETLSLKNREIERLKESQNALEMEKNLVIEQIKKDQQSMEEKVEMAEEWKKALNAKSEQLKKTLDIVETFKEESERSDELHSKIEKIIKNSVGLETKLKGKEHLEQLLNSTRFESDQLRRKMAKLELEKNNRIQLLSLERDRSLDKAEKLGNELKSMHEWKKEGIEIVKAQLEEIQKLKDKNIELEERTKEIRKRFSEELDKKHLEVREWGRRNTEIVYIKNQEVAQMRESNFKNNMEKNKEIDELKSMIAQKEEAELLMKRRIQELSIQNQKLKQKHNAEQIQIGMRQNQMDDEIREKDMFIEELKNTIIHVKNFLNADTATIEETRRASRSQLEHLEKTRSTLNIDSSLKLALEMKERLISLSNRSEIHQMAIYEYQQYEGRVHTFLQDLEKNIQTLRHTDNASTLLILPEFPSFSDRFITEYWLEIDRRSAEHETKEFDCLVCFDQMKPEEGNLTKCQHCPKIFHSKCLSDWIHINPSCPHCRQQLPDLIVD